MLLLLPSIILGLLVGLLFGGSLVRLWGFPFRSGWLLIIACLMQIALFFSWFQQLELGFVVVAALHTLSNFLFLAMVYSNRSFLGFKILGLGILLNFVVIVANGGFMPISQEVMLSVGADQEVAALRDHPYLQRNTLMTDDTRLGFLGDTLYIDAPAIRDKVFSLGDTFIALGSFVVLIQATRWRRRRWDWA